MTSSWQGTMCADHAWVALLQLAHRAAHPSRAPFCLANRKRFLLHWRQDWHSLPSQVSKDIFITQLHNGVCSSCSSSHSNQLSARVCPGGCFPFSILTYTGVRWCKLHLLFCEDGGKNCFPVITTPNTRVKGTSRSQPTWLRCHATSHSKCREQD